MRDNCEHAEYVICCAAVDCCVVKVRDIHLGSAETWDHKQKIFMRSYSPTTHMQPSKHTTQKSHQLVLMNSLNNIYSLLSSVSFYLISVLQKIIRTIYVHMWCERESWKEFVDIVSSTRVSWVGNRVLCSVGGMSFVIIWLESVNKSSQIVGRAARGCIWNNWN